MSVEKMFLETKSDVAFAALYTHYYQEIFYAINKIVFRKELCEELVNDVFLKVRAQIDRYDPQYSFKTWLYTVAINEAKTIYNIEKKKQTTPTDFTAVEVGGDNISGSDMEARTAYFDYVSQDQVYDASIDEKHDRLVQIINQLGEKHKDIMFDREVNGLSYEDLSKKYNVNLNTVRSRLKDGRAKVAKEYKKIHAQ